MKTWLTIILIFAFNIRIILAQDIKSVEFNYSGGFEVTGFISEKNIHFKLPGNKPLVSLDVDDKRFKSIGKLDINEGVLQIDEKIALSVSSINNSQSVFKLIMRNITFSDTLKISNIVPFGEDRDHVFITGRGGERLSKTKLFLPGKFPLSVIVPDNAWELGYSSLQIEGETGVYALARRTNIDNGSRRRFWTDLNPGGKVEYTIYFDLFSGPWQAGLRKCFQEKYLYDLEEFDNQLFRREDLAWIREAYVIHLIMAWDHHFYDSENNRYTIKDFVERGKDWYGGDDVIGIWPTWPTLGLDKRNQWDLYQDLPGGVSRLKSISSELKELGTRLFISYNPWDQSTRKEDHLKGMADLIRDIDADGVILDTRGSSSKELQKAADDVKKGVVMYSEGMAVPEDMPGIIAGRVHNALYYPPILNLNKFIKPDFAIFRVAELTYERIRREYALAFFNGYGTEINMFKPGQPNWIEEDYRFLGRTTRILRENRHNFISMDWTPLVESLKDSIYINKWLGKSKTVYTIFSLIPEGFNGHLFEVAPENNMHFVDLWNHEEVKLSELNKKYFVNVSLSAFDRQFLGTNNEGAVGCIAQFPMILELRKDYGKIHIKNSEEGQIKIWKGIPDYSKDPVLLSGRENLYDPGRYEGKIVVQLFNRNDLLDEKIVHLSPGAPKLTSETTPTKRYRKTPEGMVEIPSGKFKPEFIDGDTFIYYPVYEGPEVVAMKAFFMDRYPVTNAMFNEFLEESRYTPVDTANFLKHWESGKIPEGMENHPVVYVSLKDAKAYAEWVGKRLPTEIEWQYAAQTDNHFTWPWGNEFDSLRCNPGNGQIDPVGKYENGKNPNGLSGLVGNVWQLTNDTYESGSYTYTILKGGSYFKPLSSWWYVKGGPRELRHRQILLHVSEGFDRNSTVGFRCVADAEN